MIEVGKVKFAEVEKEFLKQYKRKNRESRASIYCLNWANKKVGNWHKVRLERQDVLGVLMPSHSHNKPLIPYKGMLLKNAIKKAKKLDYPKLNPKCYRTMKHFQDMDFVPVYLSTTFRAMSFYRYLKDPNTNLYSVDGLHRMVGWGLQGRYSKRYLDKNPMYAYVAMGYRFGFLRWVRR